MTEDQVVEMVATELKARGFTVIGTCFGTQPGVDVEALTREKELLCVECKGSMSPRSRRAFSVTDCWQKVSGALFNTVRDIETHGPGSWFAIALPATDIYRSMMNDLREFCRRNRVIVLWVASRGTIDVWRVGLDDPFQATRNGAST